MSDTTTIDNFPVTEKCRHCPERSRWSIYRGRGWISLCDKHLGVALRNIGVTRVKFTTSTESQITVAP